jgi:tetratricopeptide (TPR) repeat protein
MKSFLKKIIGLFLMLSMIVRSGHAIGQTKEELLKKCQINLDKSDFNSLILDSEKLLKLDSTNSKAYSFRGIAYYYKENETFAVRDLMKSLSIDQKNVAALLYLKILESTDLWLEDSDYYQLIEMDPDYYESYVHFARKKLFNFYNLFKEENVDSIYQLLNAAIKLNPKSSDALIERGNLSFELQNYESANQDYNNVLLLEQNNFEALEGRGKSYYYTKQYTKALNDLTRLVNHYKNFNIEFELNYKLQELQVLRGKTYAKLGNRAQALIDLNYVLSFRDVGIIDDTRHQWSFNTHGCIDQWSILLNNSSELEVNRLTFKLTIADPDENVIFRKTYVQNIKLAPGDVVPTPFFNLGGELCYSESEFDNFDYYIELQKIE